MPILKTGSRKRREWWGIVGSLGELHGVANLKYYRNTLCNVLFGWILDLTNCILRFFKPSTYRITMQAWTNQQAAFLIQNICILAEAKGISSLIMNGYDEEKLCNAFRIPCRFHVSAVVALGYKSLDYIQFKQPRYGFGRFRFIISWIEKMIFDSAWNKVFVKWHVCW